MLVRVIAQKGIGFRCALFHSTSSVKIYHFLQITKNTTPMYRAPEMLDLYQNFPINQQSDIWVSTLLKHLLHHSVFRNKNCLWSLRLQI